MNEVEKMYENAGVKKITIKGCYEYYAENAGIDIYITNNCKNKDCNICKANKSIQEYPPFTAEKQLELIKLLGDVRDYIVEIDKFKGVYYVGCRSAGSNDKLWGSSNVFEDALAELINETWFCLTEEERKQIKEILE